MTDSECLDRISNFTNQGIARCEYELLIKRARMHLGPFLNIGTAEGCSAIALAHANPTAVIYTIDPYNLYWEHNEAHDLSGYLYKFITHVKEFGFENRIKLFIQTSDQFFSENDIRFDLIFIDGHHGYEYVLRDIRNAWNRLPIGGSLGLHDVSGEPGVTHAAMDAFSQSPLLFEVKASMTFITRDDRTLHNGQNNR